MKFSLECDVIDSYTKIEHFICRCYGKDYEFINDEKGVLSKIKVTATAERPDLFAMAITAPDDSPDEKTFNFEYDGVQVHEVLTSDFQYLEGMLAFFGNITRVNWQSAKLEYLPETDEEKERVKVPWIRIERLPITTKFSIPREQVAQMILRRNFHGRILNQFLAFYREGQNAFRNERFIYAFLNFYLLLEGAYGKKDRWRNAQTREDFEDSKEFSDSINEIIQEHLKPGTRNHWRITKMLSELTDIKGNPIPKSLDVEGLIWLLVDVRGNLLHFRIHDFDALRLDENHEAIAFVAYKLSQKTLNHAYTEVEEEYEKIMDERKDQGEPKE